jgi:hypothetical protein
MVTKVNGGIINNQTLTGGLRFFKIVGPFAWAISDGTVNLPPAVIGGTTPTTTYFQVGSGRPVPYSAAELALQEITKQSDVVLIGFVSGIGASSTEMHIAVSASALGWGSNLPDYNTAPANADEQQLPTTPTNAAAQMQVAIRAIPNATVYITAGVGAAQTVTPVTATANFSTATVTEVSFSLGTQTYYTLA